MTAVEKSVRELLIGLLDTYGWEVTNEELKRTPERVAKFYEEWAANNDFVFTVFDNSDYDELVCLKDIEFYSLCSHHLLPFFGHAFVAYLPGQKICGISKLARVVQKFASRPQVQERMTAEIADFLMRELDARFVMVVVDAQHLCMLMRGVKQHDSKMVTSSIKYKEGEDWQELKQEALTLKG